MVLMTADFSIYVPHVYLNIINCTWNGGTKRQLRGAGFALAAKSVTRVTVGFSDLFHEHISIEIVFHT